MVSKARKLAVKVAIPISHAAVGLAGGFGAVALVQPSEEFQAGPIVIEQTVDVGITSTFSGEELFKAPPLAIDVDLKIIDRADTPKAIQDIKDIYTTEDGSPTTEEITNAINRKFEKPFTNTIRNLALQTFGVFAAGAALTMRSKKHVFDLIKRGAIHTANAGIHFTNWALRKLSTSDFDLPQFNEIAVPERAPTKLAYGGFVKGFGRDVMLAVLMSGMTLYATGSQIDLEKVQPRVEEIASQPVREYLLTGTSKMVPNFTAINNQLAIQLERFNGIGTAIEEGSKGLFVEEVETQTFLIISDPHNLPTAPQLIEAIARAGQVDGIIILGDFLNTGAQFEVDSLAGYTIGESNFQGFDDIRTCVQFVRDECKKEGEPFEIYALLGNHDTSNLMTSLNDLGIKSLVTDPPEIFRGQVALDDACFVENDICQNTDYKEINAQAGREAREQFDFSEDNPNRPNIGFFASDRAAEQFQNDLDIIFYGGKHKFEYEQSGDRVAVGVGAIGAGFPRVAEYSNAVIATFARTPNGIELSNCIEGRWEVFDPAKGMELTTCGR